MNCLSDMPLRCDFPGALAMLYLSDLPLFYSKVPTAVKYHLGTFVYNPHWKGCRLCVFIQKGLCHFLIYY